MLQIADIFHTGLVVPDIEQALAQYRSTFGTEWTEIVERPLSLRGPAGRFEVHLRLAYTRDGPHRLELIEAVPGSPWEAPVSGSLGNVAAHHLGIWSDDLGAQSRALAAAGCPLLATYDTDRTEVAYIAYHRMLNGTVVELVDSRSRPGFIKWWAGAPFPVPKI
jgi:catechol 2,3-dioxygenase-like lactoylglutathione lyase family enzyme